MKEATGNAVVILNDDGKKVWRISHVDNETFEQDVIELNAEAFDVGSELAITEEV